MSGIARNLQAQSLVVENKLMNIDLNSRKATEKEEHLKTVIQIIYTNIPESLVNEDIEIYFQICKLYCVKTCRWNLD